ncbi:CPBP family intramembrane glutamic endopeptidase [Chloroflexus sp.]|uniref:CPBP family intramembrane glutamic endopeptidase n=1 Tax=Chloroflexus sp. TaxID=1904827 RepID=UPI00262F7ECC|nr:CPBP family intramembrane glutamic endopeptidase [uncultured Chloroflexus sp.]
MRLHQHFHHKSRALLEVIAVLSLTLLALTLIGLSPVGAWERTTLRRGFVEYAVMMAIPTTILIATRRDLTAYGLSLRNPTYHLDVTTTALAPVAVASIPFAFVDYRHWTGSLILAGSYLASLFALGWLLRRKPTRNEDGVVIGAFTPIWLQLPQPTVVGRAITTFVFFIFFLGLGEELLFRGYIQSRLNDVWGRPFRFFGVPWGWGGLITAALFGLMHALNLGSLVNGNWQWSWWWGGWTFFSGLVFGFAREKTGSIVAPALLHGLPQAIAYTLIGL